MLPLQEVPQEDHLPIPSSRLIDHQALLGTAPLEHHLGDHPEDPEEDFPEDHLEDMAMIPLEEVITIYHLLDHLKDLLEDHKDHKDHPIKDPFK